MPRRLMRASTGLHARWRGWQGTLGPVGCAHSFFREMVRTQSRSCEANTPPEPLATPNPVLDSADHVQLTVSFVVGIDGHVYGPVVLEGTRKA